MRKVLKWIGLVLGGLLVLILLVAVVGLIVGSSTLNRKYTVAEEFDASGGDATNGRKLVQTNGCAGCHGDDLGGEDFIDEAPLGYVAAPNLTAGEGGAAATFSDTELEHAIRHGVHPTGRPLVIMPAGNLQHLSDAELADIITYLRSAPPVDNQQREPELMIPATLMFGFGVIPTDLALPATSIDHEADHPAERPTEPLALGRHLSYVCTDCHGVDFAGGSPDFDPEAPAFPNLTMHESGLAGWTEADFALALRGGVRPAGGTLDPEEMPWPLFSQFTDDEVHAIWTYLQSLPALPEGGAPE